jgi:hypothetical protein
MHIAFAFAFAAYQGGEFTLDTPPDSSQSQSNETAQPDRQAKVTSPTTAGQLTEPSQPDRSLKAASTTTAGQSSEPSQPDQQPNVASPTSSSKRARTDVPFELIRDRDSVIRTALVFRKRRSVYLSLNIVVCISHPTPHPSQKKKNSSNLRCWYRSSRLSVLKQLGRVYRLVLSLV